MMSKDRKLFDDLARKLLEIPGESWQPDSRVYAEIKQYRTAVDGFSVRIGRPFANTKEPYFLELSESTDPPFISFSDDFQQELDALYQGIRSKRKHWSDTALDRLKKSIEI